MTAGKQLFAKYNHGGCFIETGTYEGDSVQAALDAGYTHVFSIELSVDLAAACQERFKDNPKVTILQGDSRVRLPEVLALLDEKQSHTFWLDGHYSWGKTALAADHMISPVVQELKLIAASGKGRTSVVMVDDVRLFKSQYGTNIHTIHKLGQEIISPMSFEYCFEDGHEPGDVFVMGPKPPVVYHRFHFIPTQKLRQY